MWRRGELDWRVVTRELGLPRSRAGGVRGLFAQLRRELEEAVNDAAAFSAATASEFAELGDLCPDGDPEARRVILNALEQEQEVPGRNTPGFIALLIIFILLLLAAGGVAMLYPDTGGATLLLILAGVILLFMFLL